MRELRYIEVSTARKIRNQRVGAYQSPLRGPGFDFDEHQPYRPGDDVRRIDWNVTARLGRAVRAPHARRARDERDGRDRRLALDGARHVASLEARNDDVHHRVAPVLGARRTRSTPASSRSPTGCSVDAAAADAGGRLVGAGAVLVAPPPARDARRSCRWSGTCSRRCKRMSIVFLVSDFVTDEDVFAGPDLAHARGAATTSSRSCPRIPPSASCPPGRATCSCATSSRAAARPSASGRARAGAMPPRRAAARGAGARVLPVPMDHVFVPTDGQPRRAAAVALRLEEPAMIHLRQGFRLRQGFGGQVGGQAACAALGGLALVLSAVAASAWDAVGPPRASTPAAHRAARRRPAPSASSPQGLTVTARVDRPAISGRRSIDVHGRDRLPARRRHPRRRSRSRKAAAHGTRRRERRHAAVAPRAM